MSIQLQAAIFDFRITTSREKLLEWKHALGSKKIVFTNGVFDMLHRGHVEYLAKASALGDILVVGLNSDQSVHRLKGPNRPIHSEEDRATVLSMLKGIDAVVYFDEDTPFELISFIVPTVLTKGADYKVEDIVGADVVTANGGDVVTIDLTEGHSTSNAIETIIRRFVKG